MKTPAVGLNVNWVWKPLFAGADPCAGFLSKVREGLFRANPSNSASKSNEVGLGDAGAGLFGAILTGALEAWIGAGV